MLLVAIKLLLFGSLPPFSFAFTGLSFQITSQQLVLHPSLHHHPHDHHHHNPVSAPAPTGPGPSPSASRGRSHLPSPAAAAEAGPCAEPERHRALLVRRRDRPQLRSRRLLPSLRLPPGVTRGGRQRRQRFALEEDRRGEGIAPAHGLHADTVCVGLNVLLRRARA